MGSLCPKIRAISLGSIAIVTKGSVSYIPEFSVLQHNHTGYWGASQVRANVEAKRRILGVMYWISIIRVGGEMVTGSTPGVACRQAYDMTQLWHVNLACSMS